MSFKALKIDRCVSRYLKFNLQLLRYPVIIDLSCQSYHEHFREFVNSLALRACRLLLACAAEEVIDELISEESLKTGLKLYGGTFLSFGRNRRLKGDLLALRKIILNTTARLALHSSFQFQGKHIAWVSGLSLRLFHPLQLFQKICKVFLGVALHGCFEFRVISANQGLEHMRLDPVLAIFDLALLLFGLTLK